MHEIKTFKAKISTSTRQMPHVVNSAHVYRVSAEHRAGCQFLHLPSFFEVPRRSNTWLISDAFYQEIE